MKILGINIGGKNQSTSAKMDESLVHEEIKAKAEAVVQGTDEISQQIHDTKNEGQVGFLQIQKQARTVSKEAEKLNKMIDTAVAIAQATGNYHNKI